MEKVWIKLSEKTGVLVPDNLSLQAFYKKQRVVESKLLPKLQLESEG